MHVLAHLNDLDRFLLLVRESGNPLARDERASVARSDVLEHGRSMAHEGHRLAICKRLLDECLRLGIFGEIPQRAVTTWIEYAIEI